MKCPKCGYQRQSRDNQFAPPTECPACGIVYAKYGPGGSTAAEPSQAHTPAGKKPSPVDESTLRQARERVERRLRKKTGARNPQDDQRAQTLKRARTLAAEGVRKRQQEWHRRQPAEVVADETPQRNEAAPAQAMQLLADRLIAPVIEPAIAPAITPPVEPAVPPTDAVATDAMAEALPVTQEASAEIATITKREETATPYQETTERAADAQSADEESAEKENTDLFRTDTLKAEDGPAPEAAHATTAPEWTDDGKRPTVEAIAAESVRRFPRENSRGGLMRLFQVVAWLILLAGVAGAVLSWITLRDVQAGVPGLGPMGPDNLPLALLLGFAYLATGVLGFAFFWVTSLISSQLTEIRKLLLRGSM
ncbi:MAG: hypothetical protein WAU91_04475 [Desulfatitalea sp.]